MRALAGLNAQTLSALQADANRIMCRDATADLSSLFRSHEGHYLRRRSRYCSSTTIGQIHTNVREEEIDSVAACGTGTESSPAAEIKLIVPLSTEVKNFLGSIELIDHSEEDGVAMIQRIDTAIARGIALHAHYSGTVTRVDDSIVVKVSKTTDQTEVQALAHIRQHLHSFPCPNLLGALEFNDSSYLFMSFISGRSLQSLWSSLQRVQKLQIQKQLGSLLADLRKIPPPSEYLGFGSPPVCKVIRTQTFHSNPYIACEEDFNKFLLAWPRRKISQAHLHFIRTSVLSTGHAIVMTHGDLAPRNIIVAAKGNSSWSVVGLIDWEYYGAYPEYWEYVRALNTVSSVEEDDWAQYLPVHSIGHYGAEWAQQMVIERTVQ